MTSKEKLLKAFDTSEALRQQLLRKLESYSAEQLAQKPDANSWSVAHVIQHLAIAEEGSLNYLQKKLDVGGHARAKVGSLFRLRLLNTALALPIKFKAPKVVEVPTDEHISYSEALERWNEIRKLTRSTYESLNDGLVTNELFKHPFAGKLNLIHGQRFMQQHMERHIKQIWRGLSSN